MTPTERQKLIDLLKATAGNNLTQKYLNLQLVRPGIPSLATFREWLRDEPIEVPPMFKLALDNTFAHGFLPGTKVAPAHKAWHHYYAGEFPSFKAAFAAQKPNHRQSEYIWATNPKWPSATGPTLTRLPLAVTQLFRSAPDGLDKNQALTWAFNAYCDQHADLPPFKKHTTSNATLDEIAERLMRAPGDTYAARYDYLGITTPTLKQVYNHLRKRTQTQKVRPILFHLEPNDPVVLRHNLLISLVSLGRKAWDLVEAEGIPLTEAVARLKPNYPASDLRFLRNPYLRYPTLEDAVRARLDEMAETPSEAA